MITELTETVEDQPADTLSKRPTSIVKNLTGDERIRQNKTELDMDDPSVRVKRQRLDSDPSQLRKTTQSTENGEINQTTSTRDVEEETPHFKLPRMPMIRYGQYWYRARIKQESRDRIYVEFTGIKTCVSHSNDAVFKALKMGGANPFGFEKIRKMFLKDLTAEKIGNILEKEHGFQSHEKS